MSKLVSISIKQDDFNLPTPEVLQEQNLAIYDLEQTNFFQLVGFEAHYEVKLNISLSDNSLVLKITSKKDEMLKTFFLSLTPLKQIINDYYTICESYFNAVKSLPIDKIESIDMGRKGIHNEGATHRYREQAAVQCCRPPMREVRPQLCRHSERAKDHRPLPRKRNRGAKDRYRCRPPGRAAQPQLFRQLPRKRSRERSKNSKGAFV